MPRRGRGAENAADARNAAASKRLIDQIIVPHFKQDDFVGGMQAGIDSMT
jgi:uncharacterized membrane protein YgcG